MFKIHVGFRIAPSLKIVDVVSRDAAVAVAVEQVAGEVGDAAGRGAVDGELVLAPSASFLRSNSVTVRAVGSYVADSKATTLSSRVPNFLSRPGVTRR